MLFCGSFFVFRFFLCIRFLFRGGRELVFIIATAIDERKMVI